MVAEKTRAAREREDYERMSKEELLAELHALLAEHEGLRQRESEAATHEQLLHELRVHQVELEMQNRELRESQGALEASRSRYADLYDFAPIAYFTFDARGCIQEVNLRGAAMLGWEREHVLGKPFVALVRLDDTSSFFSLVRRCLDTRGRASGELRFSCRDGKTAVVHVDASPVLDAMGRAVACRMAFTDVTHLKEIEAALSAALNTEHTLRMRLAAIGRAHVAMAEAVLETSEPGPEHVLKTMVEQARALVGAEFAALGITGDDEHRFDPWVHIGLSEEGAAAMGSPPRRVGVLKAASMGTRPLRLRDLREHPDFRGFPAGHPPMTSFLGVPIRRRDQVIGTLYLANKIGAEEFTIEDEQTIEMLATRVATTLEIARLRAIEARGLEWLREVIDQMPEAVLLVHGEAGVSFNRAAATLFDGAIEPGATIAVEAFTPAGEPIPTVELPHMRARRGERITGLELSIRRRDGVLVPVIVNAAPVHDGRPGAAVAVYRDMSVVKQLEKEREEWMSVVAHDLRQPAAVISFSGQLLARFGEGLGEREGKAIHRICSSSGILNRMIDDLLDATLIETHRLKIKLEPTDVVALVNDVTDRIAPALEGHPLRVQTPGGPAVVLADPGRLGQVLMNLLSNAAKYSAPESEILVQIERRDRAIEVAVTNRGGGLTAAEAACVFQRFYRTRTAETGSSTGLGLGLFIVKGLVEAHGGRIWVESVPDQTTTFRLSLPAATGL